LALTREPTLKRELLKKYADFMDWHRHIAYAFMCKNGEGGPQDIEKPANIINVQQIRVCSRQYNYGVCENGKGGVKNCVEALKYYKLAADRV